MYEIKTKDIYEDFSKDEKMLDFSNYSDSQDIQKSQDIMMIQRNLLLVR